MGLVQEAKNTFSKIGQKREVFKTALGERLLFEGRTKLEGGDST